MSKKGILERHHILEIITTKDGSDGDYGTIIINSKERLKELGLYGNHWEENYGLPPWMICTCNRSEHIKLHRKFDNEWNRRASESQKGNANSKGITTSFFGIKFKEHFGITWNQDKNLYNREYKFYKKNGYFRWEQEGKELKAVS